MACRIRGAEPKTRPPALKIKEWFRSRRRIGRAGLLGAICAALCLTPVACGQKKQQAATAKVAPALASARATKTALAKALAAKGVRRAPGEVWKLFDFAV